jgi:hypothetical protein
MMKYALVGSVLALASVAGCSSDDDGGAGAGAAAGSGGSGGSGASGGTGATAGAAGEAGGSSGTGGSGTGGSGGIGGGDGGFGSDEQCADAPTQETCHNCCINTHLESRPALLRITADCVCTTAQCGTQCEATLCADPIVQPTPGDACDTCFQSALDPNNANGCAEQIVTACAADTDCNAPFACAEQRGCESKPLET